MVEEINQESRIDTISEEVVETENSGNFSRSIKRNKVNNTRANMHSDDITAKFGGSNGRNKLSKASGYKNNQTRNLGGKLSAMDFDEGGKNMDRGS